MVGNKDVAKKKVALVTGSSSGIGYETALMLARNGFDTYATMRNTNKSKEIEEIAKKENLPLRVLKLDVTDDRSVDDAINNILNEKKFELIRIFYLSKLYRKGELSVFEIANEKIVATINGINEDGKLLLEKKDGEVLQVNFKEMKYLFS